MNRTEIDTYIAQIEIEATRLRAKLPFALSAPSSIKESSAAMLNRVDQILKHPGLEVLKQGLDNYERLPPDQKSQVAQLYTLWITNAQETLKTMQTLSGVMG